MKLEINKYDTMTHEEVNNSFQEILEDTHISEILQINGVSDLVQEYFDNVILDNWFENLSEFDKIKKAVGVLNKNIPNISTEASGEMLRAIREVSEEFEIEITGWNLLSLNLSNREEVSGTCKHCFYCSTNGEFAVAYSYLLKKFIVCKEPFQEL